MCVCVCVCVCMTISSFHRRVKRLRSDFILKLHEDGLPSAANVLYYSPS